MMRTYTIYHIKEEFADFFYGREQRFYELFSNAQKATIYKEISKKQVKYVTKPLPQQILKEHFAQAVANKKIYQKNDKYYALTKNHTETELKMGLNVLKIQANGGLDAESIFFDILRNFSGHLLAVDFENKRYGWIKPVKNRRIV